MIEIQVRLQVLEKRNLDLEERESLRVRELERIRKEYEELERSPDLTALIVEKNEVIKQKDDRIADLKAALGNVLKKFERCWSDNEQYAALRTARAILEDE